MNIPNLLLKNFLKSTLLSASLVVVLGGSILASISQTALAHDQNCVITGSELKNAANNGHVEAHVNPQQGTATIANNTDCTIQFDFAVYKTFIDTSFANQRLDNHTGYVSLAPHSSGAYQVSIPNCTYQIDVMTEPAPPTGIHSQPAIYGEIIHSPNGVCSTPTPTPTPTPTLTPTPTPTVTPTPTPTATPTTPPVVCLQGQVQQIVNSQVVCVNQNQNQNQNQTQTQNNHQTVNNSNSATGGSSSSSSSSSVTVNNTTTVAATPAPAQVAGVKIVSQEKGSVKELPKTGLPLAGVALASLLPVGGKLKRFGKKDTQEDISPNSLWMEKQFKA